MSGASIVDQVDTGLVKAALATGAGTFVSLLRRKVDTLFNYYEVTCVQTRKRSFDAAMMVVRFDKVLLVSAKGEPPKKGDHVAVGFTRQRLLEVTNWARIEQVKAVEPAGVPLLYRVTLAE